MNAFQNITPSQFEILLKTGKRNNVLFGYEVPMLIKLPYWMVKVEIVTYLKENNINELLHLFVEHLKIKPKEIDYKEIISFVLWIKDEVEKIYKLEEAYLSSPTDNDMLAAGVKELDELGELNVIDSLAQGNILKWEKIKQLPYEMVFEKLRKSTLESKINKAYHKVISQKSKK